VQLSNKYINELFSIKEKLNNCLNAFQNGQLILVGDDGLRENEVDLVFHALGSTAHNVNFAITHAKGLLCVSLNHELANKLGFSTSPNLPGGISHTNFTVSVDAKNGISSGISAKDRAHTISLMAQPNTTVQDFISPGHVFPLRAMNGGLLARAGHTEALYELCRMTNLPYAAAMCEVLGENGEALNPNLLSNHSSQYSVFNHIPFISTVDILWNRILFEKSIEAKFVKNDHFISSNLREKPLAVYILNSGLEKNITLPTVLSVFNKNIAPESIRISITNSVTSWDNSVPLKSCSAEISMFSLGNCIEEIPTSVNEFCNMNAKEGLNGSKTSVKRMISELRSIQFLHEHFNLNMTIKNSINKINFVTECDKLFLNAIYY
jgi:3,4-dihydroxy 2-butanone 4-phosphate synthase / GTP cyclohydrolase II